MEIYLINPLKAKPKISALIKENYFWISQIVVLFGVTFGLFSLWIFTWFIGRPDVFIPSILSGSGLLFLAILALTCLTILVILIATPLISSYILAGLLKLLTPVTESNTPIIFWLFSILLAGGAIFIGFIISNNTPTAHWYLTALALFSTPAGLFYLIYKDKIKPLTNRKKPKENCFVALFLCVAFIIFLAFMSFLALIPPLLYLEIVYYEINTTWRAVAILLALLVLSLLPALFFYASAERSRATKIKKASFCLLSFVVLLISSNPAVLGIASAAAMEALGIKDGTRRHYLVASDKYLEYLEQDLIKTDWKGRKYGNDYYLIEARSLYAYGSISLLCPSNVSFSPNQKQSERSTESCIPFRQDEVYKLGALPHNSP